MQVITGSVGDKGTNAAADVALVEAILLKTLKPNKRSGYLSSYDSKATSATTKAIAAFQRTMCSSSSTANRFLIPPWTSASSGRTTPPGGR